MEVWGGGQGGIGAHCLEMDNTQLYMVFSSVQLLSHVRLFVTS